MKKKLLERVICFLLSVTLLAGSIGLSASAASLKDDPTGQEKYPYSASTLEEMKDLVGTLSYEEYMANFGSEGNDGLSVIPVDILKIIEGNGQRVSENAICQSAMLENPDLWENFGDNADASVYLPAQGFTTWQVDIPEELAGLYYLKVEYFNPETSESSISSIERKLKIDDKIPFDEVGTIKFDKNWKYDNISDPVVTPAPGEKDGYFVTYEISDDAYKRITTRIKDEVKTVTVYTLSQDINGNSMSPTPYSLPSWNTSFIKDSTGYYTGYFNFYFSYGSHTITLEAEREPMIVKSIELVPAGGESEIKSYTDVLAEYAAEGYKPATGGSIIEIQAEFPDLVSDSSVSSTNDNSSAINYPVSSSSQLYNIIGENSYNSVGQWAAYKFSVTEDGLYNLGMRFNQSALQGMFVCRTIKLTGGAYGDSPTVPFKEAFNTTFNYDKSWQSEYLGADVERTAEDGTVTSEREDFLFYFEAGEEYTLYLECSLGTLKNYIQRVENSLAKINESYLQILQLTGTEPDKYRDYNFIKIMPEVLVTLLEEAVTLLEVKEGLEVLCGTNGSHIATLETVAILLNTMGKDNGDNIAANLSQLKANLGTLGTWINSSKLGSMKVDSIWVVPANEKDGVYTTDPELLPKANANFFETCWHEVKSFISSFFVKYDQMGVTAEVDKDHENRIDVWLATGRDQSQIWRTMIDAHSREGFTYNTGVAVSLKLVTGGTLLPSILSGSGPDVYIGLGSADVINYAIRNAIIGIGGKGADEAFNTERYTYRDADDNYTTTTEYKGEENLVFVTGKFDEVVAKNYAPAAMDTLTLLDTTYGIPTGMGFAMMFYRMDVLADLGIEVPQSWDEMLSVLPVLQSNNMSIGVSYISALDFMIYQLGGNMWKYTDETKYSAEYAGARIDLDSDIALKAFKFTCRLYTDYSFPVSFDAANRFRTGEIPIVIGDYASIYNTLTVYATEIQGLWEFCSLPGSKRADGTFNYDSLATVSATVVLHGCDNLIGAWQFAQWQTGEMAQSTYGNKMVALIGPSAKYETANLNAINNLSWTASEKAAIMNQMEHLSSIVNYPGSYIITRYMQFAFLDAVNNSADPVDAMTGYIEAINTEIARKRQEFDLWIPKSSEDEPPELKPVG